MKIADLREEIISIFYKSNLEKLRSAESLDRVNFYLELGELDYFLNHSNLIEEHYEDLRERADNLTNESNQLEFNFFVFKITCLAALHAFENDRSDFLQDLKSKATKSTTITNLYDVMRYLD